MQVLSELGGGLYTVASFVLALSIIVTVHEFGHYIVARWSGIRSEVFSLGFGPVLFSRTDKHGTRWQLAAIPLGGYVKFWGDANAASVGADEAAMAELTPAQKRQTMHGAPLWARAATVAAGPVFNFILSIAVFAGVILASGYATDRPTVGALNALPSGAGEIRANDVITAVGATKTPDWETLQAAIDALPASPMVAVTVERDGAALTVEAPHLRPARLAGIAPSSAVAEAGLRAGDVVIRAGAETIYAFSELQAAVKASAGAPLTLKIWRPAEGAEAAREFDVTLTPKRVDMPKPEGGFETRWMIGATGSTVFEPATRMATLWEAVSGGVSKTYEVIAGSLSMLAHIIGGEISSCNLRGAIGIAEGSAQAAQAGGSSFLWYVAALSTAVGFLNLFPIPVLDGGHLVFHAYEALRGKPPSERVYGLLMMVGVALVLSMTLFGLSNDLLCP